jgi:hypothetical protein
VTWWAWLLLAVLLVALAYSGVAAIAKALFDSPPTKPRDDYGEGDL